MAPRFPSETDHYNGENIRHVAQREGFDLPAWYYQDLPNIPRRQPEIRYHEVGVPSAPVGALDLSTSGVFLLESSATRHNVDLGIDYLGLDNAGAYKCFTQTDGRFPRLTTQWVY